MNPEKLFELALGLKLPWQVTRIDFSPTNKQLEIHIDFSRGATFRCPGCQAEGAKAYDTSQESWRHLNFFQYATHLHARVPRVQCPQKCGIKKIETDWARPESGFTHFFEAYIMVLAREMPVAAIAQLLGEHDTRLWRVIHHYVDTARERENFSTVQKVGMDETASRRGHRYVSLFVDLDRSKVLFATPGKDAATVKAFKEDLVAHGGSATKIQDVSCDMSPAFIAGVETAFPQAEITFDKFHVIKILNEAVDQVRREEQNTSPLLKKTRYVWLKNPGNLTDTQQVTLASLKDQNLKTMRAYHLRLNFQLFWTLPIEQAEPFLRRWYFWATHSRLEPIKRAAAMIKAHWAGIMRWFTSGINNGILEGINSLIQAAKARARGYRTSRNFIAMTYLIAGKLQFDLPT